VDRRCVIVTCRMQLTVWCVCLSAIRRGAAGLLSTLYLWTQAGGSAEGPCKLCSIDHALHCQSHRCCCLPLCWCLSPSPGSQPPRSHPHIQRSVALLLAMYHLMSLDAWLDSRRDCHLWFASRVTRPPPPASSLLPAPAVCRLLPPTASRSAVCSGAPQLCWRNSCWLDQGGRAAGAAPQLSGLDYCASGQQAGAGVCSS
jgi:hypothetical protein